MKPFISLFCCLFTAAVWAGPLDKQKAEIHLSAVATGNIDALMRDYADDAFLEWVGGPLDGRYHGKAAIQDLWKRWAATNEGQPRPARIGQFTQHANPQGVTLEVRAEYDGKTSVKVWHVFVYRDGQLVTELWQINPALKVSD